MSTAQDRRRKAAEQLIEPGLDALLLSGLHNVRYLTGFTGSNAMLLLHRDGEAALFTDPRYTVQSKQQTDCRVRIAKGKLTAGVVSEIHRRRLRKVGFESDQMTVSDLEALKKDLPPRCSLEPAPGLIENLRMVKDAGEIDLVRRSVIINSQALDSALSRVNMNMTEADFATEIDYQSRRLGAQRPSFDTIVAAGPRSALPHARSGDASIGRGILLIDMGAFHGDYASDMTRMVYFGKVERRYKRAYHAVLEAQLAAIDSVRPGVTAAAVDRAARRTLKLHGLEREFVHSTGHGLGLEIHERPRIGRKDKTKLEAGMTVTIEPGVYMEGWGGIRIEDTVLVTSGGCEILTPTTKDLREL
ncbi:MAG TPA: Xaa-Pro peptidase family protein [Bryobacteraceae bacterium]|nr:Xaa-Pro peptidase family protein [Bryobacteraceae bacterium]